MSDARQIEADIYERLSKVIDPELGQIGRASCRERVFRAV